MERMPPGKRDQAFESFMENLKHEARLEAVESKDDHAERLLGEVYEVLDAGIQSREEAIALLAKLDIVIEGASDFPLKAAAKSFQADIRSRYPDIAE